MLMTSEVPNMASPIRVIELAGLPGTGKTTVAQCLENTLRRAGVRISSRADMLAAQRSFMRRQWKRLELIARQSRSCGRLYHSSYQLIAKSGQRSISDFAVVTSNFWGVLALMAEAREVQDHVLIADQGLLQAIWSVQLSSSRTLPLDVWKPLILAAGTGETLLAHIEADISVSRGRVSARTRNRSRLESGSSDSESLQWQIASKNMSDLVNWAQRTVPHDQYGARVLTVMNHEGVPEEAAAEIASAYLKRDASQAKTSSAREGAHEDRLPDNPDGPDRRGANPRARPFAVVETKRT
jgi:adenylate kinase